MLYQLNSKTYQTVIKKLKTIYYYPLVGMLLLPSLTQTRSVHRPIDQNLPELSMKWVGDQKTYHLRNAHLEEYPWFGTYDKDFFNHYLLPENELLSFRNDKNSSVNSTVLSDLIDQVLKEIKNHKKTYTHFTILQTKDFNRKQACGLIVLKYKEYPFVVKLFIETPKSFTNPWGKGFEPIFFFYMGGGVNRHLSGFTRLRNRAYIEHRLLHDATWAERVDVPRKWSWIPYDHTYIDITSKNIGGKKTNHIQIPGTYALIADEIKAEKSDSMHNTDGQILAIDLCNFLNMQIDPHIKNFIIEESTQKLVIVDTEHFPTMVGFKDQKTFNNYFSWYKEMIKQCGKNMLFSTKHELQQAQSLPTESFHALFFAIPDVNHPDSVRIT